jgi:hypothetical protein
MVSGEAVKSDFNQPISIIYKDSYKHPAPSETVGLDMKAMGQRFYTAGNHTNSHPINQTGPLSFRPTDLFDYSFCSPEAADSRPPGWD